MANGSKPAFFASRKEAMRRPTHHQFLPGLGYMPHAGPPELPLGSAGKKNCDPPTDAANRSIHRLRPPNGAPMIEMAWLAAEKAWASLRPEQGNRMAWSTSHLQRAGWEYVGPKE